MKNVARRAPCWLTALACLWLVSCGGGGAGGGNNPPPPTKTTPTVSVTPGSGSIAATQSLAVTVVVSGSSGMPTGSVTLSSGSYSSAATVLSSGSATITIPAGSLAAGNATLSASYTPDSASSSNYYSGSGSAQVSVSKAIPAVTITPGAPSISTTQSLAVSISVSAGSGAPAATGSVTISSGTYTSSAATLTSGSATITIPAGSLATGTVTLSATYTPDTAASAIYSSAPGSSSVTVAKATPAVTVTPQTSSISTSTALQVSLSVSGGSGAPAASGSVVLTSGSYTSSAISLSSGTATITIPANSLAAGSDTLTGTYTPDTAGSAIYAAATGTALITVTAAVNYTLTINSAAPSSGITITASPNDANNHANGTTPFTLSYGAGTQVTLSAPASFNSYSFVSWTGCTSNPVPTNCVVTLNANATVTANYNQPGITSIVVTPSSATIGAQQQFVATVNGTGSYSKAVTWSIAAPSGSNLSPGTISAGGLYNTPYPAPATVTVTATSVQDSSVSGSVVVTLTPPATAAGPALNVDLATPTTPSENPHTISPYVYGINAFYLDSATVKIANPGLLRWGGDDTSRYNYQNGWTNSASDYYFENFPGAADMFPNPHGGTNFNQFVQSTDAAGAAVLGTVPVNGWVSNGTYACSFPQSSYPSQVNPNGGSVFNSYNGQQCGYGYYTNGAGGCTSSGGCSIYGNNTVAAVTSTSISPPDITSPSTPAPGSSNSALTTWADSTWAGGWVNSLASNASYGNAASGKGVAMWDLDNEPTWWSAVHRDIHPRPFTYDEVTNEGIATALAIKAADPTALVSGPVIDNWWTYFYSEADVWNGYNAGPCYQPWSNPSDRAAHGGVPLIEYYLQQFNSYSQRYNVRPLDYLDIHSYFQPSYNGKSVGFTTAGDTQVQQARMNGTRVFWDSTYTDPSFPQPNYSTDPSYTSSCSPPAQAPQLIPRMQTWVANDYPGTKTGIDEYNFGGLESVNGAIVQADLLGIFGRQGLDMAALWPSGDSSGNADSLTQGPANYAFAIFRNYDLANDGATFGDVYLYATSSASGNDAENRLAVYAAQRSSDHVITVVVINKTYGSLTSTVGLQNFVAPAGTNARVYQYSSANLTTIAAQPSVAVAPPASGTTSTLSSTFPAQSITLFVIPD